MPKASLELLAPRADVWGFLAEPYHLSDWWPGLTGVEPDRRGFADGARWKVVITARNVLLGSRRVETILVIRAIESYERWAWQLLATKLEVEIGLRSAGEDRTVVTVSTNGRRRSVPQVAVKRLYDLVQTAAAL